MTKPDQKVIDAFMALRRKHPKASMEKLARLFGEQANANPDLFQAACRYAMRLILDEERAAGQFPQLPS